MSLQTCSYCGWSKITTYQGLRTHQGKMGCTPKGLQIPESQQFSTGHYLRQLTFGSPFKLTEPVIFNTPKKSDKSLQVCSCGWSEITTHHGLRTHQGIMGCTPKGMKIPESKQITSKGYLPAITFPGSKIELEEPLTDIFATSMRSNMKRQVCHCGWSELTTDQGLRIHQTECRSKGASVAKSDEYNWRNLSVKNESVPASPNLFEVTLTNTATEASVMDMIQSMVGNQQDAATINQAFQFNTGNEPVFVSQTVSTQIYPAFANVTVKGANETFFKTPPPQSSQPSTSKFDRARRGLDFSAGAQQVQVQERQKPPMTTTQERVKCPEEKEKEAQKLLKAKQDYRKAEILQHIHIRKNKVAEVTSSVKSCKINLDAEWMEINSVFMEVMQIVVDARQKALQPLEDRRHKLQTEASDLIQKLEREIGKLKKTIDELDINRDLQISLDRSLTNVSVDTSFSFGSLRTTTSTMMEQIHQKLDKLSSVELKRTPSFSVDIRLDPLTAHQCLVLSDDGKTVRDGGNYRNVPNTPERFDLFGSVMAVNSLTSRRSYWEVGVSNKTGWDLGVARRDANRKGELSLKPGKGFWVIVHYEERNYAALAAPPVSLSLNVKPQKVGVFVDYKEGLVSFYDAIAQSHIYTFKNCSFGGEILPYFSPHLTQNGKNSDPLIICAGKSSRA
ncbi:E3 ubiquitin-protein ligase TRIM21-like [Solea senegalensis]|uniref:E3 ubiquitin-protein ligase TRIM21-like n=2 Tax=Solea senegalensis TaxID=28829 RepID=A0AAV6QRB1_SOLSE|nr:E3 ubiquitin-protein ligase TRIM21-like [Solea senegalensis]